MTLLVNENQEYTDNLARIYTIAARMIHDKISPSFVEKAIAFVKEYEGGMELLFLWAEDEDENEKDNIIADLESHIQEEDFIYHSSYSMIKSSIDLDKDFEKIKSVGEKILEFKKELRKIVDTKGGISELSKHTGITKPYLHRFFHSPNIPKKTILQKISKELGIEDLEIPFEELE